MPAIALAVLASASWGISDFWGGLVTRRVPVLAVLLLTQAAGFVLIAVAYPVAGDAFPGFDGLWPALVAAPAGMLGLGALYRGLAVGPMSIVAPISATGAAVPVIVGIATGDRPQALQLVGLAAAALGAMLASVESDADAGGRGGSARTGVALALVAALGFGISYVGLDAAADASTWWALMGGRITELLVLIAIVAACRTSLRVPWSDGRQLAAIGGFDSAGLALFAIASTQGLLSVVAVLSTLYPIGTVLLARGVLGERLRPVQTAGVVAAMTGVVLIAAG